MTCDICNSTQHFRARCPNTGKGKGSTPAVTHLAQNHGDVEYVDEQFFLSSDAMPSAGSYFLMTRYADLTVNVQNYAENLFDAVFTDDVGFNLDEWMGIAGTPAYHATQDQDSDITFFSESDCDEITTPDTGDKVDEHHGQAIVQSIGDGGFQCGVCGDEGDPHYTRGDPHTYGNNAVTTLSALWSIQARRTTHKEADAHNMMLIVIRLRGHDRIALTHKAAHVDTN